MKSRWDFMSNNNIQEKLNELKGILKDYESKRFRIGERMGYIGQEIEHKYKGFRHEGAITNVKFLDNEIDVTFISKYNPYYDEKGKEITFKILGYEKSEYDSLFEFQLQDIEYNLENGFELEVIVGQNAKRRWTTIN